MDKPSKEGVAQAAPSHECLICAYHSAEDDVDALVIHLEHRLADIHGRYRCAEYLRRNHSLIVQEIHQFMLDHGKEIVDDRRFE